MPHVPVGLVRRSETATPKTAFGFFGSVIATLVVGTGGGAIGLAEIGHPGLAVGVLVGGGILLVLLITWIVVTFQRDPAKFVVGPITGSEYLRILQWTSGDSHRGEQVEELFTTGVPPDELPVVDESKMIEGPDDRS